MMQACPSQRFTQISAIADLDIANAESLSYNCCSLYCEVSIMAVSYKKLWKLLIDRDMKKKICVRRLA